jgi:hypothetical protein
MITLDKKHKKTVEEAQSKIQSLSVKQHKVFTDLCEELKVVDDTPEAESLWDHLFNETGWVIKYK